MKIKGQYRMKKYLEVRIDKKEIAKLFVFGIIINFLGKKLVTWLFLPIWLDSVGTCFAAVLGGPLVGAMTGLLSNLIIGVITGDRLITCYCLTSFVIGFLAGVFTYEGRMKRLYSITHSALIIGLTSGVVSVPVNCIFFDGFTGNYWSDMICSFMQVRGVPMIISSFLGELVIDIPDKLFTIYFVCFLIMCLPKEKYNLVFNKEI